MKTIHYSIIIPDDVEIVSVKINIEQKSQKLEKRRYASTSQQRPKYVDLTDRADESEEGLLFDELY